MDDEDQLAALFDSTEWSDDSDAEVQQVLLAGIAAGATGTSIANDLAAAFERLTYARAVVIAGDQFMRAYRDVASAIFQANSDLLDGWMWQANLGSACAECTAMHGTIHSNDEEMDSHTKCACTQEPIPRDYASILADGGYSADDIAAMDLPPEPDYGPTGVEWFAQQDAATQRAILGPARAALYSQGKISLRDVVSWRHDPVWGRQLHRRTLAELTRRRTA